MRHCKNGVAGQKVRFSVNKVKKEKQKEGLLEVIEKAPQEIEPACPHFGQCGGCTYQNLPYEEQVKLKESQVKSTMDEAVDGDYIWEGVLESPVKVSTVIKWSSLLVTNTKTDRWRLVAQTRQFPRYSQCM